MPTYNYSIIITQYDILTDTHNIRMYDLPNGYYYDKWSNE